MLLAISPDVFHRVEFRSIGWQALQMNAAVLLGDVILYQAASVRGQAIPNDSQSAANVLLEMFQKLDHLRSLDAAGEESEVEIPDGDARDGRKTLPVEGILQYRSLAAWSPGSDPMRPLAQSAFVHKYYRSALLERFFLISGQRARLHCRIAGHRVAWRGPPAAGNSSPRNAKSSRHARDETFAQSAARSNQRRAKWSKARCRNPKLQGPLSTPRPTVPIALAANEVYDPLATPWPEPWFLASSRLDASG